MKYFKWFFFALCSAFVSGIVILFSPIIVLFADKDGYLPHWLAWAGQVDNSLDGDAPWRDPQAHPENVGLSRYRLRISWLTRNPAQVFDAWLGAPLSAYEVEYTHGDLHVCDQPQFRPGYLYAEVGNYWMIRYVKPVGKDKCIDVYIGWKLLDYLQNGGEPETARLALRVSLYKDRGGL